MKNFLKAFLCFIVFLPVPAISYATEESSVKVIVLELLKEANGFAAEGNTDDALGFVYAARDMARAKGWADVSQLADSLSHAYRPIGMMNTGIEAGSTGNMVVANELVGISCKMLRAVKDEGVLGLAASVKGVCDSVTLDKVADPEHARRETLAVAITLIGNSITLAREGRPFSAVGYVLAAEDIASHYGEGALVQRIKDLAFAHRTKSVGTVASFLDSTGNIAALEYRRLTCTMASKVVEEYKKLLDPRMCGTSV